MGTLTLTPPDDNHLAITIFGRAYVCAANATITVPDFDGVVMHANGWQIMMPSTVGLASADVPGSTLLLDPATGDVFQTTGAQ